jgi:hypothetical protein
MVCRATQITQVGAILSGCTPRFLHTATLLADGRALITGGKRQRRPSLTSVLSGPLNRNDRWTVTDLARFTAGAGLERMRKLNFQADGAKPGK